MLTIHSIPERRAFLTRFTNSAATATSFAPFGTGRGPQTIQTAELDSTGHLATTLDREEVPAP